eukprot:8959336-Lingulodinium_polyedra.AAC.1
MHVNVQAGRQTPFRAWIRGVRAGRPDVCFPGQRASQFRRKPLAVCRGTLVTLRSRPWAE